MIHDKGFPKLVDLSKFQTKLLKTQEVIKKKKWNLNKILLTGFLIFTVFFLYNCRYGIFRVKENNLVTTFETKNHSAEIKK